MSAVTNQIERYQEIKVALEGMTTLPDDAKEMLRCFEPDIRTGSVAVALESIGEKIKDAAKKAYEWIKEQIKQLIEFFKSGKLEMGQAKKEVDEMKKRVQEAKRFKEEKIALSPTITGYLAVGGNLSPDFAGAFGAVNRIVGKLLDLQPNALNISNDIIEQLKNANTEEMFSGRMNEKTLGEIATLLKPLATELKSVDPSKNIYNASKERVGFQQVMKVLDLVSVPLPGGYVIQGAYVETVGNFDVEGSRSKRTLLRLLETMKPELTKVQSSGISFSGKALSKNEAMSVVNTADSILSAITRASLEDENIANSLKKIEVLMDNLVDDEDSPVDLIKVLKDLIKFVKMDKDKIVRYSLRTIRAALRYVNASIETKVPEQQPVSSAMRLN